LDRTVVLLAVSGGESETFSTGGAGCGGLAAETICGALPCAGDFVFIGEGKPLKTVEAGVVATCPGHRLAVGRSRGGLYQFASTGPNVVDVTSRAEIAEQGVGLAFLAVLERTGDRNALIILELVPRGTSQALLRF
jgi:hypothetical protein